MTNPLTQYNKESLADYIESIEKQLKEARAEIERLAIDVKILSEELERERRPKMDQR